MGADSADNTELRIEYEKILDRVRQTRESVIRMDNRRFTEPVDEIEGTVATATPGGITLKEHPGQVFQFSSVGMSAADMSASILGEHNNLTRTEVAGQVEERREKLLGYLAGTVGSKARLTIPQGTLGRAERARAVIEVDGKNLNRELIDQGYGQYREHLGGAEAQELFGATGKAVGSIAEALAFQGDSGRLNPMRYIPTPGHTKAWQERTPLAQYLTNEVVGTRMRRWERPIHDFLTSVSSRASLPATFPIRYRSAPHEAL